MRHNDPRTLVSSALIFLALGVSTVLAQSSTRPEDNRPPVFFREEWKHQFDRGGPPEGPVGPEHVSHADLELKHYGESPKGDPGGRQEHTHAGMWMNKRFANHPAHLFTGTCNRPCALTLRHRAQYVDLSVLKLADGTYLVGEHTDEWVDAFDWYVSEILIASVRWRRLDPERVVVTLGAPANAVGWVEKPDLSRVDEVGFVDLMPGRTVDPTGIEFALLDDASVLPNSSVSTPSCWFVRRTGALRDFRKLLSERGIEVKVSVPKPFPSIHGDRTSIQFALHNLIDNAMRHADATAIELEARLSDKTMEFVVSDRGQGIPEDELKRAQQPFVRGGSTGRGSGLGLAIVRRIAAAHRGWLRLESRVDVGTTATLAIPVTGT